MRVILTLFLLTFSFILISPAPAVAIGSSNTKVTKQLSKKKGKRLSKISKKLQSNKKNLFSKLSFFTAIGAILFLFIGITAIFSTLADAFFVVGLSIAMIAAITSIVFAILGAKNKDSNKGFRIAGIWISSVTLLLTLLSVLLAFAVAGFTPVW